MRIPLPELGLDCEKKHNISDSDNIDGYNTRTAKNEKSVLVIDTKIMAELIRTVRGRDKYLPTSEEVSEYLSKNAKSFMRIEKE